MVFPMHSILCRHYESTNFSNDNESNDAPNHCYSNVGADDNQGHDCSNYSANIGTNYDQVDSVTNNRSTNYRSANDCRPNNCQTSHQQRPVESKVDGIYLNGAPFYIKGASYFGMETNSYAPHGLWGGSSSTSEQKVSTLLKTNNFNAVRLPLAVDSVLNNPPAVASQISSKVDLANAFSGKTLRFLDVLDHLLVLLDAHVLSIGSGITDLWYSSSADQNNFENAWSLLANRYKNTWNIIAADLKNEPQGTATWGSGNNATDWDQAAIKWATTIQKIAPHWLIFVEGISKSSRDQKDYPAFWGENLMDVQRAPITLPVANRLVYSAHAYSSDVASQPYFSASNYPDNMPALWDLHFGFVHGQYGPVVVGEYGGRYSSTSDIQWQNKFVAYLKAKSIGSFYWCVNPNSGDTEGLLLYDWITPRTDKFNLLSPLPSTPVP
ncbi:unnamed protein product [Aphanomyces euteiches]